MNKKKILTSLSCVAALATISSASVFADEMMFVKEPALMVAAEGTDPVDPSAPAPQTPPATQPSEPGTSTPAPAEPSIPSEPSNPGLNNPVDPSAPTEPNAPSDPAPADPTPQLPPTTQAPVDPAPQTPPTTQSSDPGTSTPAPADPSAPSTPPTTQAPTPQNTNPRVTTPKVTKPVAPAPKVKPLTTPIEVNGVNVVGSNGNHIVAQGNDGSYYTVEPTEVAANQDTKGTWFVIDKNGKKTELPKTGEKSTGVLSMIGLSLLSVLAYVKKFKF